MSSATLAGGGRAFYGLMRMTGNDKRKGDPRRAERLKAALRENLKRRKAQERARSAPPTPAKSTLGGKDR
jgi:hypothetical protein